MTVSKALLKLHYLSAELKKLDKIAIAQECSELSLSLKNEFKEYVGVQFLNESPNGTPYFSTKNIQACKLIHGDNCIISVYLSDELFRQMDELDIFEVINNLS